MGLFDNFTGGKSRKDLRGAEADARTILTDAAGNARTDLNAGIKGQLDALRGGYTGARSDLGSGYLDARKDLTKGYGRAETAINDQLGYSKSLLNPYIDSGNKARTAYDTALGLNGDAAQSAFATDYADNDPYRELNEDMATRALQRLYNADGSSSDGRFGLAASRANLERGSQDWNRYLDRLDTSSARGGGYATTLAGFANNAGSNIAELRAGLGRGLADNSTSRGRDLAELGYGYGQDTGNIRAGRGEANANLTYGLGQQLAANRIGRGNAIAGTRDTGMNNLLQLGATAIGGFTPNKFGDTAFGNMKKAFA
jgi:hypothetical protein